MNDYVGHDKAWRQFATACDSDKIHHGWILAGPRGIGKSAFALRAAAMLVDPENAYASMIARGSHPDILSVKRLPKEPLKEDEDIDDATEFKRSITYHAARFKQPAGNYYRCCGRFGAGRGQCIAQVAGGATRWYFFLPYQPCK
jgi:DNA polymerase III delta prime subunit